MYFDTEFSKELTKVSNLKNTSNSQSLLNLNNQIKVSNGGVFGGGVRTILQVKKRQREGDVRRCKVTEYVYVDIWYTKSVSSLGYPLPIPPHPIHIEVVYDN